MNRHIEVELSTAGMDLLINELEIQLRKLDSDGITKTLAETGAQEVRIAYSSERHSAEQSIDVSIGKIVGGHEIIAKGHDVLFAEFGAGVYFNTPDKAARPAGIKGIGEFGKELGKNKFWTYLDESGKRRFSWGQPQRLGFVNAKAKIIQMVKK